MKPTDWPYFQSILVDRRVIRMAMGNNGAGRQGCNEGIGEIQNWP